MTKIYAEFVRIILSMFINIIHRYKINDIIYTYVLLFIIFQTFLTNHWKI